MAKHKKNKDSARLFVVLTQTQGDRIQHMAIKMSAQEGKQITVSEAMHGH